MFGPQIPNKHGHRQSIEIVPEQLRCNSCRDMVRLPGKQCKFSVPTKINFQSIYHAHSALLCLPSQLTLIDINIRYLCVFFLCIACCCLIAAQPATSASLCIKIVVMFDRSTPPPDPLVWMCYIDFNGFNLCAVLLAKMANQR